MVLMDLHSFKMDFAETVCSSSKHSRRTTVPKTIGFSLKIWHRKPGLKKKKESKSLKIPPAVQILNVYVHWKKREVKSETKFTKIYWKLTQTISFVSTGIGLSLRANVNEMKIRVSNFSPNTYEKKHSSIKFSKWNYIERRRRCRKT